MKLLLSLLVVANILVFGWFRGWMAPLGGDGREPQRMERQVSPDRLRPVVGEGAANGAATGGAARPGTPARPDGTNGTNGTNGAGRGGAVTPDAGGATPADTGSAPAAPAAVSAPAPIPSDDPIEIIALLSGVPCVEIGPMSEADVVRVQVALDAVASDLAVRTLRAEDVTAWWVYIAPPLRDIARLIADLRGKGVTDLYVIPDGIWKGAISLGLFRQEELAINLQRSLTERGVRGVRFAPRGPSPGRIRLQVRPVPSPVPIELARLRADMPDAIARPCADRAQG